MESSLQVKENLEQPLDNANEECVLKNQYMQEMRSFENDVNEELTAIHKVLTDMTNQVTDLITRKRGGRKTKSNRKKNTRRRFSHTVSRK